MKEIVKIWLTDSEVWIQDASGAKACEKFADYPRLRDASAEQRKNYVADGFGLQGGWEHIASARN